MQITQSYTGELGAIFSKDKTVFKLWAPSADRVIVNLYPDGYKSKCMEKLEMSLINDGAWETVKTGNLDGVYYTYTVFVGGKENEAVDPYAKAGGVNGKRAMVVDLTKTNPKGWENDKNPPLNSPTDAIVYELSIRDFSMSKDSGMINKGKYLAFTEKGTTNSKGIKTGIDYLAELGITHVQLLPCYDFGSIDERSPTKKYNWGYDPENYNFPEGSYSTDPYNGHVRIREFKQMIQSLHKNGLRVVMDVVFNHTYSLDSNLNKLVPGYYYRKDKTGEYSDGSACGNETASERFMMRRLIIDSVVYWATEYKINGFRFDLMGLHDIETMNEVRAALDKIDPSIILYGEGWTGGATPLPEHKQALKKNAPMLDNRIGVFSDDIRDGIKGHVFKRKASGFINGKFNRKEDIKFGITAACFHLQIDYSKLFYSNAPWAKAPAQAITYAAAHDNLTLWDKLVATKPGLSKTELIKLNKLAALLILTSQGISFLHAGDEIARTKDGDENSFVSSDKINRFDWNRIEKFNDLVEYYKGLMKLRKTYPAFRMQTAEEIAEKIHFIPTKSCLIAYTIRDKDKTFLIAINADTKKQTVKLPENGWDILVNGKHSGTDILGHIDNNNLEIPPRTGVVLIR